MARRSWSQFKSEEELLFVQITKNLRLFWYEKVVEYDNELNEVLDDVTPTTDIAGGSIVIDTKDNTKNASLSDDLAKKNI